MSKYFSSEHLEHTLRDTICWETKHIFISRRKKFYLLLICFESSNWSQKTGGNVNSWKLQNLLLNGFLASSRIGFNLRHMISKPIKSDYWPQNQDLSTINVAKKENKKNGGRQTPEKRRGESLLLKWKKLKQQNQAPPCVTKRKCPLSET